MGSENECRDPESWQAGFADGLAGRRSPRGNRLAYRSGYISGSARRISRRTMMAAALATLVVPMAGDVASPEFDPIFTLINQHRQDWETLKRAPHDDDQGLHEALLASEFQVVNTRPTTTAGIVALRNYHREHRYHERLYPYPYPYPGEYGYWGKG
jgi:hypothetical protein